jgi:KDO2-lipid IV(A) lauroyltransferase
MRLLLGLLWLLHWLPLPLLGRLGEAIGALLFIVVRPRRHIALTNLRLCLPELTEDQRCTIARQHFKDYARAVLERGILWWGSPARLKRLIAIEPAVPVELIGAGPLIFLCPHFVCLDVAATTLAQVGPGCAIYTRQRSKVFDRALLRGRTRFHPIKVVAREEGVKPIIRAMRQNLPFMMLPDMDFGIKDAEFVPFFGVPAATLTAPARIAALTGATVVPVVATFLPGYRGWKVSFYPPWQDYPGDDLLAATRRMNAFIEARAREAPAEYFWTHKRFKTRPPGVADVYDPQKPLA